MKFYNFIYLFLSAQFCSGQWQQHISYILQSPELLNAQVAIHVRDTDAKTLYNHNGNALLIPASTQKIVSCLATVDILGWEFQFKTQVAYDGQITDDKTLYGNIIIKGSGDPSLGAYRQKDVPSYKEVLAQIVNSIKPKISCVDGFIIIDASIFDEIAVHPGWAWDDLSNYYATGVWGLNFHQNSYRLSFARSQHVGDLTEIVSIAPHVSQLEINNHVTLGRKGSGDQAYIFGGPYALQKNVRGTIPIGNNNFTIRGAVPDARRWFAQLLKEELQLSGIESQGIKIEKYPDGNPTLLAELRSPPLNQMVKYALATSDNLYCDAFYKLIGTVDGEIGSWDSANKKLKEYLRLNKFDTDEVHIEDGSGLTLRNRIASSFLTDFLQKQYHFLGAGQIQDLMPKAGRDGSVKRFLQGYPSQSAVWVKSGSVNGVLSYTGFIKTENDKPMFFSVNVNGYQGSRSAVRKKLEHIIDTIYAGVIVD